MSARNPGRKTLLWIMELGGYPNFLPIYQRAGYEVVVVNSVRKALGYLKKSPADVIIAEFNYQSDFRDRTSSLETLFAQVQTLSGTRVIVFYDREFEPQLERVRERFPVFDALAFPIEEQQLEQSLQRAGLDS